MLKLKTILIDIKNNRKTLMYIAFVLASILVVWTFLTSTTYAQLAIATLLYPPLVYFAFICFPPKPKKTKVNAPSATKPITIVENRKENVEIVDIDKRAFLKMIGAVGLSYFIFSIFTRRAENLLFGGPSESTQALISGKKTDPIEKQTTHGYKISEIDNGEFTYYGFINKEGSWYIMREDPTNGSFRYVQGGSDFPNNWNERVGLTYDYFDNVFSK